MVYQLFLSIFLVGTGYAMENQQVLNAIDPFVEAIKTNKLVTAHQMLAYYPSLRSCMRKIFELPQNSLNGLTLLHLAAYENDKDLALFLIDEQLMSRIDRTPDGHNALTLACAIGKIDLVLALLERGLPVYIDLGSFIDDAEIRKQQAESPTDIIKPKAQIPLNVAFKHKHKDIIALLKQRGAKVTQEMVYDAIQNKDAELITFYWEFGAPIHRFTFTIKENRVTALHLAVSQNDPALVRSVLSKNPELLINQASSEGGNTPLHFALLQRQINPEIIKALVEHNPECTLPNNVHKTPIEIAQIRDRGNNLLALFAPIIVS